MVRTASSWNLESRLLITELQGNVAAADVERWRNELHAVVERIPDGTDFSLLLDLTGFEPIDLDAHKAMRNVIPMLLAAHGMRPAFIDLFDEKPELPITVTRNRRCVAFANVHHDAVKMGNYRRKIGREDQQFFTSRAEAERWIASVHL